MELMMQSSKDSTTDKDKGIDINILLIKGAVLLIMIFLLLVPLGMVSDLVHERQERYETTSFELKKSWGDLDTILTPYLIVHTNKADYDLLLVFPKSNVTSIEIDPKELTRGIYKTVMYTSRLNMEGVFPSLEEITKYISEEYCENGISIHNISLNFTVNSKHGIGDISNVTFGKETLSISEITNSMQDMYSDSLYTTISFNIPLHIFIENINKEDKDNIDFKLSMNYRGAGQVIYIPNSSKSSVSISGNWKSPSFSGIIPVKRDLGDSSFQGEWSYSSFDTSASIFKDKKELYNVIKGIFKNHPKIEVKLYESSTHYSLVNRSVKYAVLFIIVTVLVLLILGLLTNNKVHLIHYVVICVSIILFYLMLLSLSEHFGFIFSYIVSSLAVALPVSIYTKSITGNSKYGIGIFAVEFGLYLILLSILYMENYALLTGTLLLFAALYTVMFLTRNISRNSSFKINWDSFSNSRNYSRNIDYLKQTYKNKDKEEDDKKE